MADIKEKITIEGNFKEQVKAFTDSLIKSRLEFKNLVLGVSSGSKNIKNSMSLSVKAVNKYAEQFIKQGDTVEQAIKKATQKVERYQNASIDRIAKKYIKLGKTITEAYDKAKKEVNVKWNGADGKQSPGMISSVAKNIFSSKLGKGLSVLGVIGLGITAIRKLFETANNISNSTLDVVSKISFGVLSPSGLANLSKQGLKDAMEYENAWTRIDSLASNVPGANAEKIYTDSINYSRHTPFTETDVAKASAELLGQGINPTPDILKIIGDLGASDPDKTMLDAAKAFTDAINGDSERLKEFKISTDTVYKYYKSLPKDERKYFNKAMKKQGSGYQVINKKQYEQLLRKVIESKFGGSVDKMAQTLTGHLSTLEGISQQTLSELVGYNSQKHKPIQGGLYEVVNDFIGNVDENGEGTGLAKWLNDLPKTDYFKRFQQSLGSFAQTFADCLIKLDKAGLTENLFNTLSDCLDKLNNKLIEMSNNGTLDKLAKDLPDLLEASLNYKLAELDVLEKEEPLLGPATTYMEFMTRFLDDIANIFGTVTGKEELNEDNTWIKNNAGKPFLRMFPGGNNVVNAINGIDYIKGLSNGNKDNKTYTDYTAEQIINRSGLSIEKKESVKEKIEHDNINKYEIHIEGGENYDELANKLVQAIENAQANR